MELIGLPPLMFDSKGNITGNIRVSKSALNSQNPYLLLRRLTHRLDTHFYMEENICLTKKLILKGSVKFPHIIPINQDTKNFPGDKLLDIMGHLIHFTED